MNFLTKIASMGIGETLDGIGGLAVNLRTAIKGYELKPEQMAELEKIAGDLEARTIEAQSSIVVAEAKGHWLQRNWRPMLMCLFGIIIANNYIIHPYVNAIWPDTSVMLTIPPDMWSLLKLGVGGYIVGRSVEKGIEKWKS
ncbi:MAG: hypothetical protein KAS32_16525 [Candidatus Peribacteraceae bacterium]|nr:hypothetical protein [Candidatus Peribacteraceae bacterium]